jgi:hypothetical protein
MKDKTNLEQSLVSLINVIKDNDAAKQFFVNVINKKNYMDDINHFFSNQKYLKEYFKGSDIGDTDDDKKENSVNIIVTNGLRVSSVGTVVDKTGREYPTKLYANTTFSGGLREVVPCIIIEGKIIPVSEIEKNSSMEGTQNV